MENVLLYSYLLILSPLQYLDMHTLISRLIFVGDVRLPLLLVPRG
jgi:hypothetical protein